MKPHGKHHPDPGCECEGKGKECGCHHGKGQHHHREHHGGRCSCETGHPMGGRFSRRHKTKAEQIAELETYLGDLKLEMQAVEEILAELRK